MQFQRFSNRDLLIIFGGILLFAALLATGILILGSKINHNSQTIQDRATLASVRTAILQDAIREECRRENARWGRLIPLEEASKLQISQFQYYRNHPKEKAKALRSIDRTIKILRPVDCNAKIKIPINMKKTAP